MYAKGHVQSKPWFVRVYVIMRYVANLALNRPRLDFLQAVLSEFVFMSVSFGILSANLARDRTNGTYIGK